MKKQLLSGILSLCCIYGHAQITISSADMPNPNDSVLVSIAAGIGSADATLTGAGYTWDFSSLSPASQRYEKFDSPLSFTSPFNIIFNPINCSYGKINYQLTSLPIPGITFNSAYDFYKESTSSFKQVGAGYTINSTPLPFLYTNADVIYNFPLDYGNIDSCMFKFGLPIPTIAYYGEIGHRHSTVDGWGTVITPFGSFNALRQTSVIDAIDSIYVDAFGFGTNVPRPTQYQFKWLANGMKIPVLEIDANDVAGNLAITNVEYIDSLRTAGVNDLSAVNTTAVYPNPSEDQTIFQFNNAKANSLRLFDITGKQVKAIALDGSSFYVLNRNGLVNGVYFYEVSFSNSTVTSRGKLILH